MTAASEALAPVAEGVGQAALGLAQALWGAVVEHAPAMLSAFGLLLLMWLVARLTRALVARVLRMTRLDAMTAIADLALETAQGLR